MHASARLAFWEWRRSIRAHAHALRAPFAARVRGPSCMLSHPWCPPPPLGTALAHGHARSIKPPSASEREAEACGQHGHGGVRRGRVRVTSYRERGRNEVRRRARAGRPRPRAAARHHARRVPPPFQHAQSGRWTARGGRGATDPGWESGGRGGRGPRTRCDRPARATASTGARPAPERCPPAWPQRRRRSERAEERSGNVASVADPCVGGREAEGPAAPDGWDPGQATWPALSQPSRLTYLPEKPPPFLLGRRSSVTLLERVPDP